MHLHDWVGAQPRGAPEPYKNFSFNICYLRKDVGALLYIQMLGIYESKCCLDLFSYKAGFRETNQVRNML